MKAKKIPGIPSQTKGRFHDTETIRKIQNPEEIEFKFNILKERFLEINSWGNFCNENSIQFNLCDSSGKTVNRSPQIGDYIKILLKKINHPKKKDYYWVRIDMIDKSNPNRMMIQCRPSKLPGSEFAGKIFHFYSAASTSTFIISKGNDYIKMAVYGRNEKANHNTDFLNNIKNIFIALGGILGGSKIQWKLLTDGLINAK